MEAWCHLGFGLISRKNINFRSAGVPYVRKRLFWSVSDFREASGMEFRAAMSAQLEVFSGGFAQAQLPPRLHRASNNIRSASGSKRLERDK